MSQLKKTLYVTFLPGSPYVPSVPGVPARSAYSYSSANPTTGGGTGGSGAVYGSPYTRVPTYRDIGGEQFQTGHRYVPTINSGQTTNLFTSGGGGGGGSTTINVPATAAVPPRPSIRAQQAKITTQLKLGWNAGAFSIDGLSGSGAYEFTVPATVMGVVTGLNNTSASSSYEEIDYGIYLTKAKYQIVEDGNHITPFYAYVSSDVFRIERNLNKVTYFKNGVVVYESTKPSAGRLIADSSLYSGGDAISSAELIYGGAYVSSVPVGMDVEMLPLDSAGSENGAAVSRANMLPINTDGVGRQANRVTAMLLPFTSISADQNFATASTTLQAIISSSGEAPGMVAYMRPIIAQASNRPYASSQVSLLPLGTEAESGKFTPTFSVIITSLPYLNTLGSGMTGEIGQSTTELGKLRALSSDHAYGSVESAMMPMTSYGVELPRFNAVADFTISGGYTVSAAGRRTAQNSLRAVMKFSASAFGGASGKAIMPRATLSGSGSVQVVGRASLVSPTSTVVATGSTGGVGRLAKTFPRMTAVGYSGAVLNATLHDGYALNVTGTSGGTSRLSVTMPLFGLVATGITGAIGYAEITSPSLRSIPANKATIISPRMQLVAIGTAVVEVAYEGYCITLDHTVDPQQEEFSMYPVTRFTGVPFDQLVRFGEDYYGVSSEGIFKVGGDTDEGQPIPWELETVLTDMGTVNLKRIVSVTVGGRVLSDVEFTLIVGEKGEERYTYTPVRGVKIQNYRQLFGKGVRTRYCALNISSTVGGTMDIDSIDFEISNLTRTI